MAKKLLGLLLSLQLFISPMAWAQTDAAEVGFSFAQTAYVYWQNKHYSHALFWFQKARAYEPGNAIYLANIGGIHLELKEYIQAVHWLKRALELNPSHAQSWYNLGKAYLELEQYQPAKFAFSQAQWFDKNDHLSQLMLNWLRLKEGLDNKDILMDKRQIMPISPPSQTYVNDSFFKTTFPPLISIAVPGAGQLYSGVVSKDYQLLNFLSGGLYLALSGLSYGFIATSVQRGEPIDSRWPWMVLLGGLTIASPLQAYFMTHDSP